MIGVIDFFNLWALGFLILVPLLILLYFLKLKRPQIKVASTLLWQKVLEDMRVNSPFQRLKKSLLLLLQLILLLLLIFALARPWLKSRAESDKSIIVMIDISASMMTENEDGKTRLEEAKRAIGKQIQDLHHKSEMMILTFDSRASIVCSFTNNRNRLKSALANIEANQTPTDIGPALRIAAGVAKTRKNPRLLLYSDGGFPDPGKIELPMQIEYQQMGTKRSNLAITQMNIRRSLLDQNEIELFVSVSNFGDAALDGEMKVMLDDKLLDSKYFSIDGGKTISRVFQAKMRGAGIMKVEYDTDDALAVDNVAYQIVQPPRERRILVISENPYYIFKALRAIPNTDVTIGRMEEFPKFRAKDFVAVIWSNVENPKVADTNNIYFGCQPNIAGLTVGGEVAQPDVAEWDTTHPINRFIDYSNLVISKALAVTFPKNTNIILSSSKNPLVGVVEQRGRTLVVSTFDIHSSSWPFQVTMLYFIRNCLEFFDEQHLLSTNTNVSVGGVLSVPPQEGQPTVTTPSGTVAEMTQIAGGIYNFSELNEVGIYTVSGLDDKTEKAFAVNLFSRQESDLLPVSNPIANGELVENLQASQKVSKEYYRELLIAALIILVIEWIVYHRRILS